MKGFIELTSRGDRKILLNVNLIECVFSENNFTKVGTLSDPESIYAVKETYDEVKQKIMESMQ